MDLCDDGHDQVCYETRKCPACAIIEKREELQNRLDDALEEIKELERNL